MTSYLFCWKIDGTLRRFRISSRTTIDDSRSPVRIAFRTLLFGRIFAKFKDLGVVVHVGNHFLRFFAELVDLLCLASVLKEVFFVLVLLELLDQLLDLVLTCCSTVENGWYARDSVIHNVVPAFPVTLCIA